MKSLKGGRFYESIGRSCEKEAKIINKANYRTEYA